MGGPLGRAPGAGRHTEASPEGAAEGLRARVPDLQGELQHRAFLEAQQERCPLQAEALHVGPAGLADRGPEATVEVVRGEVGVPRQPVQRQVVVEVGLDVHERGQQALELGGDGGHEQVLLPDLPRVLTFLAELYRR